MGGVAAQDATPTVAESALFAALQSDPAVPSGSSTKSRAVKPVESSCEKVRFVAAPGARRASGALASSVSPVRHTTRVAFDAVQPRFSTRTAKSTDAPVQN